MKPRLFAKAFAILLTITLIAPSAFLSMPQRAKAISVTEVGAQLWNTLKTSIESTKISLETTISAIKNTISAAQETTTAWAQVADRLNKDYLQPLAFILSGNLMKMLTAGVIAFVIGKANGTGIPQFVVDVQKSFQTVADGQALAYLRGYGNNSNSPFKSSIVTSLRKDYLSNTSLAGFWAANMSTLARSTPSYAPGYLTGNWSQGGIRAWFALTTQTQNNPYLAYSNAKDQMSTLIGPGIGGATGARLSQLNWGQGFASWCGANDGAEPNPDAGVITDTTAGAAQQTCIDNGGNADQCQTVYETYLSQVGTSVPTSSGVNPGDPCTNKDGTPGTIRTPGSVIVATLNKVLGGQQDQVVRMGNVGPQINSILGNIATVMQTVNFAVDILGNASLNTASGGLLGSAEPSSSNSASRLAQFTPTQTPSGTFTSGYLGVTQASVAKSAGDIASSGSGIADRISQYETAWGTIGAATRFASTTVVDFAVSCPSQQSVAQNVLTNVIQPVLDRATTAASTIAAARAMVLKVQNTSATSGAYATDALTLQTIPPTINDVANATQETHAFGDAVANPLGSLNISANSLVDKMNLISANAVTLKASCNPSVSGTNNNDTGGGTGD